MADIVNVTICEDDNPTKKWKITRAGGVFDLTSATVIMVIKASTLVEDDASSGVYTLTVGAGLTVTDAAQGEIQADIPAPVTESPSSWFYKIRVTVGSHTETAIEGWLMISDA